MLAFLLSSLVALAPVPAAPQDQLFEDAYGWRVFKGAEGCVGFFKTPGTLSLSVFYPNTRDGLSLIIHAANVPTLAATLQTVFVRTGRSEWGPVDGRAYESSDGLPGVMLIVRRAKALAEFGKASEIAVTKRFTPPRVIPLVATDRGADMLARCVG